MSVVEDLLCVDHPRTEVRRVSREGVGSACRLGIVCIRHRFIDEDLATEEVILEVDHDHRYLRRAKAEEPLRDSRHDVHTCQPYE